MPTFDKSKLVRGLAQGRVLVPYLERALTGFDEDWEFHYEPKHGDKAWHPSGDCMPTASDLYLRATGQTTRSFGPTSNRAFMVGHFWHQWLQYIVLHKLQLCEPEAIERVAARAWGNTDYTWVRGSGDIAPLVMANWRGIVDFKTMSAAHYKESGLPARYANTYLCQINIYMDIFHEERALIVAIQKDSPHGLKEFSFVRDQPLIDSIYRKWKFVSECLRTGTPPTEADDIEYALAFKST